MLISPADAYAPPVTLEEEVTELFEQLRDPLFRYLLSFGLSVQDGEEIIQEVFLALFQHLKNGKPRDNLRGWVFRVGHNLALKVRQRHGAPRRKRKAARSMEARIRKQQALYNQRQQRMSAVIRALPRQDRACLALRAEGIRYREIAEILGVSLGTVALSLERSLAKLSRVHERLAGTAVTSRIRIFCWQRAASCPPVRAAEIRDHLAECPSCRLRDAGLRADYGGRRSGAASGIRPAFALHGNVQRPCFVRVWRRRPETPREPRHRLAWAAAAILLVGVGAMLVRLAGPPRPRAGSGVRAQCRVDAGLCSAR